MSAHDRRSSPSEDAPLAVLSGSGGLPFAVADGLKTRARAFCMFPLDGVADPERVKNYPHVWVSATDVGGTIAAIRERDCRDVVFIGGLSRPPLWKIRVGLRTLAALPTIIRAFRGGDDHLLRGAARVAERYGFRVLAAHEVAPEILMPEGVLTRRKPSEADYADIRRGLDRLHEVGLKDIGQATVVADGDVLETERKDGTDAMLARVAELRRSGRVRAAAGSGVLVKAPKPQQDRRFDLPAIGPRTVQSAKAAGLGGIAVIAGETVVAEIDALRSAADAAGLFVVGLKAGS